MTPEALLEGFRLSLNVESAWSATSRGFWMLLKGLGSYWAITDGFTAGKRPVINLVICFLVPKKLPQAVLSSRRRLK